jgi:predicted ferric reductase
MKRWLILAGFAAIYIIVIITWWDIAGTLITSGQITNVLMAIARLAGLLAALGLLLQTVLIGRATWVETVFGLDKLSRVHRINGYVVLGLILVHPTLNVLSSSIMNERSFLGQLGAMLGYSNLLIMALVGFLTLLATIFFSISIVRRRLKYEWWYFVHLFNYAAIVLIFWHQLPSAPEILGSMFRQFWLILHLAVAYNILWFRIFKPLLDYHHFQFEVTHVEDLGIATSIYFSGRNLDEFKIQAGQFMIFRFMQKGYWWQAHPFSLSMAPPSASGRYQLRITAKKLGDYTKTLPDIKVGTKILLSGPHGVFTARQIKRPKLLFIAGGIGITPIRSLLEELGQSHRDKTLLYSNKTPRETVLGDELANLAAKNNFRLVNVYSDENVPGHEFGQLDQTKLARLVPDIAEREVFLCGPPAMMTALRAAMTNLGVPKNQIHFERFAL